MEHIGLPKDPVRPLAKVPYLVLPSDGDQSLLSKVTRNPGSEIIFESGIFQGRHPSVILSIIQSIWYFGFLQDWFHQVWTVPFEKSDFVDGHFITTARLHKYVSMFSDRFSNYHHGKKGRLLELSHVLIMNLRNEIYSVIHHPDFTRIDATSNGSREIVCSILVIAETLQLTTNKVCGMTYFMQTENDKPLYYIDHELSLKWLSPIFLRSRLLERGWCPSELESITIEFGLCRQYYLSNLRRQTHARSHDACSMSSCLLKRFNNVAYPMKHQGPTCSCGTLGTTNGQVEVLLRGGSIPRLSITAVPFLAKNTASEVTPVVRMRVVDSGKFVAISHVWSQGLGNPQANELHECQLFFLHTLVQNLYPPGHPPVHLWIDTLCVPAESEAKKLGLKLLGKAFSDADKVLAIDQELLPIHGGSWEELLTRINCSEWMRRLWTLNEAVLAKEKLYFQFSQRAFSAEALLGDQSISKAPRNTFREWLAPIGYDEVTGNLGYILSIKNQTGWRRLAYLLRVALRRQTTEASDEAICIASSMNLQVDSLLEVRPEKRMKQLITMLQKIPSWVIFSDAPKLKELGFYWAPSTFLMGNLDFVSTSRSDLYPATWTGSGVHVQLSGLRLRVKLNRFLQSCATCFYISHENRWMLANYVCPDGQSTFQSWRTEMPIGFALATYPSVDQRRAILVGLQNDKAGGILTGTCLGRFNLAGLRYPLKGYASSLKEAIHKQKTSGIPQNEEDQLLLMQEHGLKDHDNDEETVLLDSIHEGLFSLGCSAVATEIIPPSQWWHIR